MNVKDKLLFRTKRLTVAVWNVWWWWHKELGKSCVTYYVGPFVVLIDKEPHP